MNNEPLDGITKYIQNILDAHENRMMDKMKKAFAAGVLPEPSEFLTIEQTAKMLSVSKPTLHKLRTTGKIPAYKVSKGVRYKKNEILDFINTGRDKNI